MARDSQKQRLYDAENKFRKEFGTGFQFGSVDDIAMYVFNLVYSNWFRNRFHVESCSIDVRLAKKGNRSRAGSGRMRINQNRMDEVEVLHELVHIFVSPRDVGHGREFCMMYLQLVKKKLGEPAEEFLKKCFKDGKVKFRPKRKATVSLYHKGEIPPALLRWREEQKASAA